MQYTTLGRTGLRVSRTSFGALPIQRVSFDTARELLRTAFEHGINFFDTARAYSDSEEKIGFALGGVRSQIHIATKTLAKTADGLHADLETSLRNLKSDYVDLLQLHNPDRMPVAGDELYDALSAAQRSGKVRYIGITCHRLDVARQAAESGLYHTVQFPLSAISSEQDLQLIPLCAEKHIGLIAMKAMCGGLLRNAGAAFAFLRQYDNVVPIWGVQHPWELDQFLAFEAQPPVLDEEMWQSILADRKELSGNFCRACGYCLPCPAGIPIPMAARMTLLLRRMPAEQFLQDGWQEQMMRIEQCTNCGHCTAHCPYHLETPSLLKEMLDGYRSMTAALR